LRRALANYPPSRVVLEVGTHSPWVSRLVGELGHERVVANPRRLAVIYSPLSYQVVSEGKVRPLIDFATAMPPNLIGGWTATEKNLTDRRAVIQKGLNALYGALEYMRNNPDYAIKTIAENNELSPAIAKMEYEKTFSGSPAREDDARPVQKAMDWPPRAG
jgi:NitT/TauT family transport system substrate-binding protein